MFKPASDEELLERQLALPAEATELLEDPSWTAVFADIDPPLVTGSYVFRPDVLAGAGRHGAGWPRLHAVRGLKVSWHSTGTLSSEKKVGSRISSEIGTMLG